MCETIKTKIKKKNKTRVPSKFGHCHPWYVCYPFLLVLHSCSQRKNVFAIICQYFAFETTAIQNTSLLSKRTDQYGFLKL